MRGGRCTEARPHPRHWLTIDNGGTAVGALVCDGAGHLTERERTALDTALDRFLGVDSADEDLTGRQLLAERRAT